MEDDPFSEKRKVTNPVVCACHPTQPNLTQTKNISRIQHLIYKTRGIYSVLLRSFSTRQKTPRIVKNGRKLPSLRAFCRDFECLHVTVQWAKICKNGLQLAKMGQNGPHFQRFIIQLAQIVPNGLSFVQSGFKWAKMAENGPKWLKMGQNN